MTENKFNMADKQCKYVNWRTPPRVLNPVRRYFEETTGGGIGLDPATTADNPVGAKQILTERDDGLSVAWNDVIDPDYPGVFVNPPYGENFKHWITKIGEEARNGLHILALFPANRFETGYFQDAILQLDYVGLYVRRRLHFHDANDKPYKANTAGNMLLLFNGNERVFADCFRDEGRVFYHFALR